VTHQNKNTMSNKDIEHTMSNKDIERKVKSMMTRLAASIDPQGHILNSLFQENIITLEQKSEVSNHSDAARRADGLLHLLFKIPHPRTFLVFKEALKKDYQWLVDEIDCNRQISMPSTSTSTETAERPSNGNTKTGKTRIKRTYKLKDLGEFVGVKETPTLMVKLVEVSKIIKTPGKKCNLFFETFLDDHSTKLPVRAAVFDKKIWHTPFKKLELKNIELKAGHYYVKKKEKDNDLGNDFEIGYKFLPQNHPEKKKLQRGKQQGKWQKTVANKKEVTVHS
jgi:hypothetical protein